MVNILKAQITVPTGEVWATAQNIIFRSDALGSCVAVAAYDPQKRLGSLAHIMLPGKSTHAAAGYDTKYAGDAVEDMLFKMKRLGADVCRIEACLVGGANVLNDEDDALCRTIIMSVSGILKEKGIRVVASALGGTQRRGISLDVSLGEVDYFEGDGKTQLLHIWGMRA